MTGVTVRVPGTTANLGSGFDFLGMAVDRWLEVSARCVDDRSAPAVALERRGTLSEVGVPPDEDLIYRGFAAACRAAGRDVPGRLAFTADSDIPVSRGLGSSAAAVVAGATAANTLLGLGLGPGATLSGSGPTLVAVTTHARSSAVGLAMVRAWADIEVNAETFVVT